MSADDFDRERRRFLHHTVPLAAVAAAWSPAVAAGERPAAGSHIDVTEFGAVGDGRTPSAVAFQRALDMAEAAGGGRVHIPAGTFLLERTPLVGSRVHLVGAGAGTVLRGVRPGDHRGAALISNKGQRATGYQGAHDWSISHLAIDSPHTNGIVVTHAARVYLGFIYGVDVYHHFIDIAARDVLCENLFLTGRSGTSTFQVDSLHGAQTIWDGHQAVAPRYDGTDTEDLILRNSIITATAGHTGDRPRHDASVHFHGGEARGFLFSDLILGGATTGFYQDADTRYDGIQINNVRSLNSGRAVYLNAGRNDQRDLVIRGVTHLPTEPADRETKYRGMEIHGREGVSLSAIQLAAPPGVDTDCSLMLKHCRQVRIDGIQARGQGGCGIRLGDDNGDAAVAQALITGCLLQGFEVGCEYTGRHRPAVWAHANLFDAVTKRYRGITLLK